MYVSTKPTVYLIDGLNLVRSFLYQFARTEEEVTEDFLEFLSEISLDDRYAMHRYEVIFDGSFRPVGPLYRGGGTSRSPRMRPPTKLFTSRPITWRKADSA